MDVERQYHHGDVSKQVDLSSKWVDLAYDIIKVTMLLLTLKFDVNFS